MQFGLFGGARTKRSIGLEDSQGYQSFIDYVIEADKLGLQAALHGRASLHRPGPGLRLDDRAGLSRGAHPAHPARHRGGRAAVAQSGADRRAGRDARPADRRPGRFRRRQGLSQGRVRRLLHPDRRGDRALRRGDGDHPQGVDDRRPLQPSQQALAATTTSWSSRSRCSALTRRCGSPPAAATASAAPRARATTCCSTSSRRPTRSSSASRCSARNASASAGLRSADGRDRAATADDPPRERARGRLRHPPARRRA